MPQPTDAVALTFEGGGDVTPLHEILRALTAGGVRATFFIDGRWGEERPELIRAIGSAGHEFANHGYRHVAWTEMSDAEIVRDLAATERIVHELAASTTKPWARPPYGSFNERVTVVLDSLGYEIIYRDAVDGAHWPGETTPDVVVTRALRAAEREGIIVFHTNRAETAAALPRVLDKLAQQARSVGPLSSLNRKVASRPALHPDFRDLRIVPGAVLPARSGGHWQSMNVLELGAALAQPAPGRDELGRVGDCKLDLVTGAGDAALDWQSGRRDRFVLVLAGQLRCEFRDDEGYLGCILARSGDLFLCPADASFRLGPEPNQGRRFIALMMQ